MAADHPKRNPSQKNSERHHGSTQSGVSSLETVDHFINMAAERLGLPDDVLEVIKTAYREITVQVPVKLADGTIHLFYGYRVQHNGARGPYKGGLRYHERVNLDEVRAMASTMSWKTAIAGIPFGGAKGGINCSPSQLSPEERETITRSFMDKVAKEVGPMRDIMAPDLSTDAQVMAWLMDEYGKLHGHTPAIVTGKPISLGGSYGRESAVGRGLVYVFREVAPQLGLTPPETRVAIQGFGKVGSWTARLFQQLGSTIVGLANTSGAIYSNRGIDADSCYKFVKQGGKLPDFPGAELIDPDELLAVDCDVFVPAALAGTINRQNADKLKCRMVLEGANSPTTPAASEVLESKNILVVPDVMANAGGVIVSYFEWVQNLQHFRWEERKVDSRLGTVMRRAYREVRAHAEQAETTLRLAAFELGIERVVEASRIRGYI